MNKLIQQEELNHTVNLPNVAVFEYQELYFKLYGLRLSYKEALAQSKNLIQLFRVIYKPIKKEWIKNG